MRILEKVGAITVNSHVVLTTGRHSDGYINLDELMPHTEEAAKIGKIFAQRCADLDMDLVVGPAVGGIVLSQWVAYFLSRRKKKEILSIFAEKDAEKNQVLGRGFDKLVKGKKILVVEDFTSTGSSVAKVIDSVRAAGGKVICACVIVNREPERVNSKTMGVPLRNIDIFRVKSWTEKACPLCKKGVAINTKVGHGADYLEKKRLL